MLIKALRALSLLTTTALLVTTAGCRASDSPRPPTTLVLVPDFEPSWNLTQLELTSGNHQARWPASPGTPAPRTPIRITLSDPADIGKPMLITVWGLRSEERIARGQATAIPQLAATVEATVKLALIDCTSSCALGTRECDGDGVKQCVPDEQAQGCTVWASPVPCPADTPYCSLGTCSVQCEDECSPGESRCAAPNAEQTCGESDSDPCRDWSPTQACVEGWACDNTAGSCEDPATCQDDCAIGNTRCDSNGVASCGQHDADDCLDWGPPAPCPDGGACSAGACTPCADGADCNDTDPCTEQDQCQSGVCSGTPVTCTPQGPACLNDWVLRTWLEGTCTDGTCAYLYTDETCPEGCAGDACTCTSSVTTIPGTLGTGHTSIAVRAAGDAFVAYVDAGGALQVAHRDSAGGWTLEKVASQARDRTSITLAPSGAAHVALVNPSQRLAVADRGGLGNWSVTVVDSTTGQGSPSIAADASGGLHVAYVQANTSINYARRPSGGAWTVEPAVLSGGGQRTDVSIGVDAQGVAHVSYVAQKGPAGAPYYVLEYAYRALGGSWTSNQVDGEGSAEPGMGTSLVVNPLGGVFIAYVDSEAGLKVARTSVGGTASTVALGEGTPIPGRFPSLARDSEGHLHLAYAASGGLWHVRSAGTDHNAWQPAQAASYAGQATGCALAVGADGAAHVSFQDTASTTLRYARLCP